MERKFSWPAFTGDSAPGAEVAGSGVPPSVDQVKCSFKSMDGVPRYPSLATMRPLPHKLASSFLSTITLVLTAGLTQAHSLTGRREPCNKCMNVLFRNWWKHIYGVLIFNIYIEGHCFKKFIKQWIYENIQYHKSDHVQCSPWGVKKHYCKWSTLCKWSSHVPSDILSLHSWLQTWLRQGIRIISHISYFTEAYHILIILLKLFSVY